MKSKITRNNPLPQYFMPYYNAQAILCAPIINGHPKNSSDNSYSEAKQPALKHQSRLNIALVYSMSLGYLLILAWLDEKSQLCVLK